LARKIVFKCEPKARFFVSLEKQVTKILKVRYNTAMSNKAKITKQTIKHVANLSNIPVSEKEQQSLRDAFEETLNTIEELQSVDITNVEPTHQVTGFKNVLREDKVDQHNMFTQEQALANAPKTHKGFFVVPRIIEEK